MASLSTCHLGLWLGWQILLNLVKDWSQFGMKTFLSLCTNVFPTFYGMHCQNTICVHANPGMVPHGKWRCRIPGRYVCSPSNFINVTISIVCTVFFTFSRHEFYFTKAGNP